MTLSELSLKARHYSQDIISLQNSINKADEKNAQIMQIFSILAQVDSAIAKTSKKKK